MTKETDLPRSNSIIQSLANQGLLTDTHPIEITKLTGGDHNFVYRLRNNDGIDWVINQCVTDCDVPLFSALPDHEIETLAGELSASETTWPWLKENTKQRGYHAQVI